MWIPLASSCFSANGIAVNILTAVFSGQLCKNWFPDTALLGILVSFLSFLSLTHFLIPFTLLEPATPDPRPLISLMGMDLADPKHFSTRLCMLLISFLTLCFIDHEEDLNLTIPNQEKLKALVSFMPQITIIA